MRAKGAALLLSSSPPLSPIPLLGAPAPLGGCGPERPPRLRCAAGAASSGRRRASSSRLPAARPPGRFHAAGGGGGLAAGCGGGLAAGGGGGLRVKCTSPQPAPAPRPRRTGRAAQKRLLGAIGSALAVLWRFRHGSSGQPSRSLSGQPPRSRSSGPKPFLRAPPPNQQMPAPAPPFPHPPPPRHFPPPSKSSQKHFFRLLLLSTIRCCSLAAAIVPLPPTLRCCPFFVQNLWHHLRPMNSLFVFVFGSFFVISSVCLIYVILTIIDYLRSTICQRSTKRPQVPDQGQRQLWQQRRHEQHRGGLIPDCPWTAFTQPVSTTPLLLPSSRAHGAPAPDLCPLN